MKKPQIFHPISLTPSWVKLNNQLTLCQSSLDIKFKNTEIEIFLSKQQPLFNDEKNAWNVELSIDDIKLNCIFHQLPTNDENFKQVLIGYNISELPPALLLLILQNHFSALIAHFEQSSKTTIRIIKASYDVFEPESFSYIISGHYKISGTPNQVFNLGFNAAFLPLFKQLLNYWPKNDTENFEGVPFSARIGQGFAKITYKDFKCLDVGDVLLLNTDNKGCLLFVGNQIIDCIPKNQTQWQIAAFQTEKNWQPQKEIYIVKDPLQTPDPAPTKKPEDADNGISPNLESPESAESANGKAESNIDIEKTSGINPDEIQLRLNFDVGDYAISIKTLNNLNVGAILEIGEQGNEVNVRCNDRLVAKGRWVDIEGKTGVILTEIILK